MGRDIGKVQRWRDLPGIRAHAFVNEQTPFHIPATELADQQSHQLGPEPEIPHHHVYHWAVLCNSSRYWSPHWILSLRLAASATGQSGSVHRAREALRGLCGDTSWVERPRIAWSLLANQLDEHARSTKMEL